MKKSTFQFLTMLIIAFVFQAFISTSWAQTPQKMSYQAVVRNSSDQLVANKIVGMRISIMKGSETGTTVYTETQKPSTNTNGLVSVEIGTGSSTDNFSAIDWANGPYFIKTETDPAGGTSYTISGISQLLSVPYALHAKTVEIDQVDDADADPTNEVQVLSKTGNTVTLSKNGGSFTDAVDDADADPANEIQTLSLSGTTLTLSKNGGTVTLPSSGGGDNWGTQTAVTNATLEGNGSTASPLKIAQQGATAGQTLKWNGTVWAPGDDAKGAGLTLPYSDSISYSDCGFSIYNSLGMGIKGESSSPTGTGVFGGNSSPTGYPYGLAGYTCSPHGISVYADNTSSGTGVFGSSVSGTGVFGSSIAGTGVFGRASQESGTTYGVNGSVISPEGIGVYGHNDAQTGSAIGVEGESSSETGIGVYGSNSATAGTTYGVKGTSSSSEGWGVYGEGSANGVQGVGVNYGVRGKATSSMGMGVCGVAPIYGVYGEGAYAVYGSSSDEGGYGVFGTSISCGVRGFSGSETGIGVVGNNPSLSGYTVGVKGVAGSVNGTGVYGDGGQYGVYGSSERTGVYGYSTATTGFNYGVRGESDSPKGTGVYGGNSISTGNTQGVYGLVSSPNGIGVVGENTSITGDARGVAGTSNSPSGTGVFGVNGYETGVTYGVEGLSYSNSGTGVLGRNVATTGYTYGVKGVSSSSEGIGVYGKGEGYGVHGSSNNGTGVCGTSNDAFGVTGQTASYNASGVLGIGTGNDFTSGVQGNTGESTYPFIPGNSGVLGRANEHMGVAGTAVSGIGVYGKSNNYAGYFDGRLVVTGNVGIGTIDPTFKLDVAGSINLNKGINGGAVYCNGNEALWFNGDCYSWGYGGTWNFFQRKVHIGGSNYNPAYMLYVEGDAAKSTGSSVWIIASDIRLKDIQGDYEKGLKEIVSLRPVKFNYKAGNACNLPSDKNYVGFIAQDVQKIFPEAVSEGKDGYLTLDVNSINVALVNAVKELNAENDRLKAESNNLKAENELLKLKNDQIDSRLTKLEKIISASAMK